LRKDVLETATTAILKNHILVRALAEAPRDRLTLIEAVTDPLDVPPLLVAVAEAAARANARR
jgi:TPP-dependent 2-oxoacid decarboxylase